MKTAEQNRDEAVNHLDSAYKCLLAILDTDTWNGVSYNNSYIDEMHEVALAILKLKRKI